LTYGKNLLAGDTMGVSYPMGSFLVESVDQVGFVNFAGGDFHLSASSLGYHTAFDKTVGQDVGANIDVVNQKTSGVQTGQ
jgi:hypothetical protein